MVFVNIGSVNKSKHKFRAHWQKAGNKYENWFSSVVEKALDISREVISIFLQHVDYVRSTCGYSRERPPPPHVDQSAARTLPPVTVGTGFLLHFKEAWYEQAAPADRLSGE